MRHKQYAEGGDRLLDLMELCPDLARRLQADDDPAAWDRAARILEIHYARNFKEPEDGLDAAEEYRERGTNKDQDVSRLS